MKLNYSIIDAIESSIYWKDLNGKYIGCNRWVYEMVGLSSREDVIGKTCYELPWKSEADKIRKVDLAVIKNNKRYQMEEYITMEDGTVMVFLTSKTPWVVNNTICGVVGVSIDITKSKRLEGELKQTKQDLSDILKFIGKDF